MAELRGDGYEELVVGDRSLTISLTPQMLNEQRPMTNDQSSFPLIRLLLVALFTR